MTEKASNQLAKIVNIDFYDRLVLISGLQNESPRSTNQKPAGSFAGTLHLKEKRKKSLDRIKGGA
jgi:hypothetical protein